MTSTTMVSDLAREALEPFAKAAVRIEQASGGGIADGEYQFPTVTMGDLRRARAAYDAIGAGVKGLPDHVAQHYGDLGLRIVDFFDKDETAGSFLREDGDGGFVGGLYRMAREIDALRTGAGVKAAWEALGEAMSQGDYSRAAFERIEAALRVCLSSAPVEEADAKAVELSWTANCVRCGRIVDTREERDGGDSFGCELSRGGWTCSFECWEAEVDAADDGAGPYGGAKADEKDAPPASTIPSEPEAKGEAGAGPVGEAWGREGYIVQKASGRGGWIMTDPKGFNHYNYSTEQDAINGAVALASRLSARPVDEPGVVERLTRERDDAKCEVAALTGRLAAAEESASLRHEEGIRYLVGRETAEAALDETREENARLNTCMLVFGAYLMEKGEAFRTGEGAELLDAYSAALSTQESSAALADGKEVV